VGCLQVPHRVQFGINLSLPPNENEPAIRLNRPRRRSVPTASQKIEFGAIPAQSPNLQVVEGEFGGSTALGWDRSATPVADFRDRFCLWRCRLAAGTPDLDKSAPPRAPAFPARNRSARRAEARAVQQPRQIFFNCAFIRASSWLIGSTYFVSFVSAFETGATRRADDAGGAVGLS
jgi:hypothetical protein